MWVTIMLCAGICRVCARYRRRQVIEINQADNAAVIVVRPNERAPLLMFPQVTWLRSTFNYSQKKEIFLKSSILV